MQVNVKRLWPAIAIILLLALSATGCGGGATESIATRTVSVVERVMPQIGLPRITVTYDETGVPEVFGVKTSTIARLLPGVDLSFMNLPSDTLKQLQESNLQHIELEVNDAGLFVYANGKGLPYLAWSEEGLKYVGELIDRSDAMQFDETIAKAMPLLGRIGIDVVAKFPVPEGVEAIPVRDRKDRALVEAPEIGESTVTIQATIDYSGEGVPSVAGITSREIAQVAQTDLSSVELTGPNRTLVKAAGLENVAVVTESDGLHLLVNEQEILHLAYNEQHLMNAIEMYGQFLGEDADEELATLMSNLAPILQGADIDLLVNLPSEE